MPQIAVPSRPVKRFAGQDKIVQSGILNLPSEAHLGHLSETLLKRLSGRGGCGRLQGSG